MEKQEKLEWPIEVVEEWCLENLGDPKQSKGKNGTEFLYNDFIHGNDRKKKLSINVGHRAGSWRSFRTGLEGDFIKLVAEFHNISEGRAFRILLDKYVNKLDPFQKKKEPVKKEIKPVLHDVLPQDSFSIAKENEFNKKYRTYLLNRGMTNEFVEKCYYTLATEYAGRKINLSRYVIIPYYDKFDKIVYWTARCIDKDNTLRYFNQPEADAGHFVYGLYNVIGDTAVAVEGVFKAEKLPKLGIATGGKVITDEQIMLIAAQNFKRIIIIPDNEPYQNGRIIGSPQKAIESAKKLLDANQKPLIFNWPEFVKHHKLKRGIKDIDEVKLKWHLDISDIEPFLMDSLYTAEIAYRLNESL